jgi:amino acid transporter
MNQAPQSSTGRLFKVAAQFILLGLLTFSIVRNVRGLDMEFAGVSFGWQVMIAVTITLASCVLTGSSILIRHALPIKTALFACGIMFSVVSFFLSYSGAKGDMKDKYKNAVLEDPQVIQLNQEIEDIIDRADVYGISDREKSSLLQREKELRQDLRIARERATKEAQNRSRKEELNVAGIVMFAALPEIGIITFTIVIVLLSYQTGHSDIRGPIPTNGQYALAHTTQENANHKHEIIAETDPTSSNKNEKAIEKKTMSWDPFS